MKDKDIEKSLAVRYEKSPVMRGLVQLIPFGIGSAADVALIQTLQNIKEDRAKTFFDTLNESGKSLTEEQTNQEPFLHAYFITSKAALNTRVRKKIQYFAKLLASAHYGSEDEQNNYEELVHTLDDVSFKELHALTILHRYEQEHPKETGKNDLQRSSIFWNEFQSECCKTLSLDPQEFEPFMAKINRTGLYREFVGTYWSYNGGQGMLTRIYHRLYEYIVFNEKDFPSS